MLVAGNVSSQLRQQRFPRATSSSITIDVSFMNDDSDDDEEPQLQNEPELHPPPRIREWRSNLVALSQRENLYFAAYQGEIHVTIPQGLKQMISSKPDLIIDLPTTTDGLTIPGHLDRLNGNHANHIITGNLGSLELLLVACDNGDVIAYYTHSILAAIKMPMSHASLRPFFHENVGKSAWGLAIHPQSRMIAIGSNNREVVVYHFGCTDAAPKMNTAATCEAVGNGSLNTFSEQMQMSESSPTLFPPAGESPSTIRGFNFRRILRLGEGGDNIPSIDFSSDSNGEAHSVLATDILGNLWVLSIWRDGSSDEWVKRIPSFYKQPSRGQHETMGWGVLALPLRAFKKTATPEQALGIREYPLEAVCTPHKRKGFKRHFMFDISRLVFEVNTGDKSVFHPAFGFGIDGPGSIQRTPSPATSGLGFFSMVDPTPNSREKAELPPPSPFFDMSRKLFEALINNTRLAQYTYMDPETIIAKEARLESPRPLRDIIIKKHNEQKIKNLVESELGAQLGQPFNGPVYHLQDHCAILRTYQDDIELIPPCDSMPLTMCQKVLGQDIPRHIMHQASYERLIFHILIVELSLAIVGSQVGRVALISLTRPEDSFSHHGPATTFRLEHILPSYTHEAKGFRPSHPLLGIAASPLQGQQKERKRWRLIMQYFDHSILSYEISRDGEQLLVV